MKTIIKLFAVLMLLAGISLLVKPEWIFDWLESSHQNMSMYVFAIGVRLVLGILFVRAAAESKYPAVLKVLGYLFIIAAVAFIVIGHESFKNLVGNVVLDMRSFARIGGLLAVAFGAFLVYAFPKK